MFSGKQIPAVGVSLGIERVCLCNHGATGKRKK
jgi:histidyl-tRNA synthetase